MAEIGDLSFDPATFSGKARLFPLPNLVLFPHVMQPLHIFEPRYRQMIEQAMAGDRLIGMALLASGWEQNYDGRPPVRDVACLARVANCQPLADGRYNILVLGLRRIKLVRELPPKHLFRESEVRLLDDAYDPAVAPQRANLQHDLVEAFRKVLPALTGAREQLHELLSSDIPLGMLTDIIGYTLDLDLECKQELLAEPAVDRRAKLLLAHLASRPLGAASGLSAQVQRELSSQNPPPQTRIVVRVYPKTASERGTVPAALGQTFGAKELHAIASFRLAPCLVMIRETRFFDFSHPP